MLQMMVRTEPFTKEQIPEKLKEHGVRVNGYAEAYFAHPRFSVGCGETIPVTIASLRELGFEDRATLAEIFGRLPQAGLRPCSPGTGLHLRLAWHDQPEGNPWSVAFDKPMGYGEKMPVCRSEEDGT